MIDNHENEVQQLQDAVPENLQAAPGDQNPPLINHAENVAVNINQDVPERRANHQYNPEREPAANEEEQNRKTFLHK